MNMHQLKVEVDEVSPTDDFRCYKAKFRIDGDDRGYNMIESVTIWGESYDATEEYKKLVGEYNSAQWAPRNLAVLRPTDTREYETTLRISAWGGGNPTVIKIILWDQNAYSSFREYQSDWKIPAWIPILNPHHR